MSKSLKCRLCYSPELFLVHDFGKMPLANELAISSTQNVDEYDLRFHVCSRCGVGQVEDVVLPERIFSDYRYLSSASSTFLAHAKTFSDFCKSNLLNPGDWILEIASNDGYLLRYFQESGYQVLGVEPAQNVSEISSSLGIKTIAEFFSNKLAKDILSEFGFPKIIIANNVLAHVPDILDFASGIATLVGPKTLVSIENPSILGIFVGNQFDTIYHEHFSYLSCTSMSKLCELVGLKLVGVEKLDIHGGSNRYWLGRRETLPIDLLDRVDALISIELSMGLIDQAKWKLASNSFLQSIESFREFIQRADVRVGGYGAAAKASTLINATGVSSSNLVAIADISEEKQGRYMPRQNIPIVNLAKLENLEIDELVVFPWNISKEIVNLLDGSLLRKLPKWSFIPTKQRLN